MSRYATHHVLLVEDDPADANLVRLALQHTDCPVTLHQVGDGQACLDYLQSAVNGPGATVMPHLVLLDLNLPKLNGREVLRKIRGDESLRGLPVVVLTTSVSRDDISKCFRQGANSFHTKPMDFDEFLEMIRSLTHYWFRSATLPA